MKRQSDPIEAAWRTIIRELGYDPKSPHLLDSPKRVAKFLRSWHTKKAAPPLLTVFPNGHYDGLVLVDRIPFYSLCAHHGLPFNGVASIAYVPGQSGTLGLSKFARIVDHFAHRFQVQEELTAEITHHLERELMPKGLAVVLKAEHLCMAMRGVERPGAMTTTSELRGIFRLDPAARAEVMSLVGA